MVSPIGNLIVVRPRVYTMGMTAAILRRMVHRNLAPGSLMLSLSRSERRLRQRSEVEQQWLSDFVRFADSAFALAIRTHLRQLQGDDVLAHMKTMARLYAFLAKNEVKKIASWWKENCFQLLDRSLQAGDEANNATGDNEVNTSFTRSALAAASKRKMKRARKDRQRVKKLMGTRSSRQVSSLFASLIRSSGLQSFREGIALGLSARILPAPILTEPIVEDEARKLRERLTGRPVVIPPEDAGIHQSIGETMLRISNRIKRFIKVEGRKIPLPTDSKIVSEADTHEVLTSRCIAHAAESSNGRYETFIGNVRTVEAKPRINKTLFLAEPGYKVRVASIPPCSSMVTAGRTVNQLLLRAISKAYPAQTSLGIGTPKEFLAEFKKCDRQCRWLYSTDLTAATDHIDSSYAMSAVEDLITEMVNQGFTAAESVFWDQLPEMQTMAVCHQNSREPFMSFTMKKGVLMGKPLTWPILTILQLTALEHAGLLARSHIVGDDALVYASEEEYADYVKTAQAMGLVFNPSKTHRTRSYGILAQNVIKLVGVPTTRDVKDKIVRTTENTLWAHIEEAARKQGLVHFGMDNVRSPRRYESYAFRIEQQIPYVPELLAARGQLRKDPYAPFNLPSVRRLATLPRWIRDRVPNAFARANPQATKVLLKRGVDISYPVQFGGAAVMSVTTIKRMTKRHLKGAYALGRYILANPTSYTRMSRLMTTQATHKRVTVTPVAITVEKVLEDIPTVPKGKGCDIKTTREAVRSITNDALVLLEFAKASQVKDRITYRFEKTAHMAACSHPSMVLESFANKARKMKVPRPETVYKLWKSLREPNIDYDPEALKDLWRLSNATGATIVPTVSTNKIETLRLAKYSSLRNTSAQNLDTSTQDTKIIGNREVSSSISLFGKIATILAGNLELAQVQQITRKLTRLQRRAVRLGRRVRASAPTKNS
ncbi:RNA-dependent RNA polymerase [Hubei narna-like virus 17]|uniref:RNA-dependent RNA polymerase n=1 Tax=Hubei narna-like virus 17 TaxID=1922947 RepID=UPI00090A2D7D|nr:RNA-dependent RNA polymerase [Hubei narna-like virus 17]APG77143.1 RNA-dependent RNA polymerase [Hubei narna-like virus 17]